MAQKVRLPTEEEIRSRAYQIYLERGCRNGYEVDDWLQAEYELIQLPLDKIAKLEALAAEEERVKNLKLLSLARIAGLKKQSKKQVRPVPSLSAVSSVSAMASNL